MNIRRKAYEAIRKGKLFTVYGRDANGIRKALLNRGWIEKLPPDPLMSKLNIKISKISAETRLFQSFLKNYDPNFIWAGKLNSLPIHTVNSFPDCFINNRLEHRKNINDNKTVYVKDDTIVNKLKVKERFWCSKTGLCTSLKDTSWHYIENVAEVYVPRTYINTDRDDLIDFVNDYLLTACTGLLRWILDNFQGGIPIFRRTGKISINVMIFALNRCKEYLNKKEHKYIDGKACRVVTSGQWNSFITKQQSLIAGENFIKLDNVRNIPLLVVYAHYLLKKILIYRPQLSCEGCRNVWIIKPSNLSMGAGIRILSGLNRILNMITRTVQKYVVQKYIGKNYYIYL